MPGQWAVAGDGGYLGNDELSMKLRFQAYAKCKLDQLTRPLSPKDTLGRKNGDTILFDRIDRVTPGGQRLTEQDVIPEAAAPITQGDLVVEEWGNSIPYTGMLNDVAEFDINNIYHKRLMDDLTVTKDNEVARLLRQGLCVYTPTGTTAAPTSSMVYTGTPTGTVSRGLLVWDLREIAEWMEELHIEPIDDAGNFLAVVGPSASRQFMEDSEWRDAAHYGDVERIFTGELGQLYGFRFVKETNALAKYIAAGAVAGTLHKGEAFFLGADVCAKATCIEPEIRAKVPGDYGREKGLAWYGIYGYGLVWNDHAATALGADGRARFVRVAAAAES